MMPVDNITAPEKPKAKVNWAAVIRGLFTSIMKQTAVKVALFRLFSTLTPVGFKAWLATQILELLFEEIAVPIINAAFREGKFYVDKTDGKIKFKKLQNAEENHDENGVDDIIDNA